MRQVLHSIDIFFLFEHQFCKYLRFNSLLMHCLQNVWAQCKSNGKRLVRLYRLKKQKILVLNMNYLNFFRLNIFILSISSLSIVFLTLNE